MEAAKSELNFGFGSLDFENPLEVVLSEGQLAIDGGRGSRGRPRKISPVVKKMTKASDWGLEKFLCVICKKPYQTLSNLQKHTVAKHRVCQPVIQVKCEFCGNIFADEGDFYKHVDSSHFEISRITGVVAQPHKEKVGYSRSLGEVAREEAQEDGESNREILNRNFNYTEGLEFLNRDKTY